MRISDWSSDVCSSDLEVVEHDDTSYLGRARAGGREGDRRQVPDEDGRGRGHRHGDPDEERKETVTQPAAQPELRTGGHRPGDGEIGSASCRERVGQYV